MAHPNDKPPHCKDCGIGGPVHPWPNDGGGHVWLCGSCAYKRQHPEATPMPPKSRAPKIPQKESLLDLLHSDTAA